MALPKPFKFFLIFAGILLVVILITLIVLLRTNTGFLTFFPPLKDIIENNGDTELVKQTIDVNGEKTLSLPEDFQITVFTSGLVGPRVFDFDDKDNLYVADKAANKVYVVPDKNEDGKGDENIEIDASLLKPSGVHWYKDDLYVASEQQVVVYRDIKATGKFSQKKVLIPNLPTLGHETRTIVIGPDEKIYVSIGSSCNVCDEVDSRRATIMRYSLSGKQEKIYAKGLRNTVGFVFKDNEIWGVDNGRDMIGNDLPPEEVNIIKEDKHYGWPYCYGDRKVNPEYPDKKTFCETKTESSKYDMQAHSAPLSIDFMTETDDSNFPSNLSDNAFIGFHGSWNRTIPTGYKVVRIDTSSDSSKTINFITGWLQADGTPWGRPVNVGFNSKNVMFLSDDVAGVIYRVTYLPD
jgi:glucose/arabinose dehydrogenase